MQGALAQKKGSIMDITSFATTVGAGAAGALLGAVVAWRVVKVQAKQQHARLVTAAREQLTASTNNMRATNARLQAELEKERTASQQRVAASAAEQRASIARLEGQLRFAYAEIDRLNAVGGGHRADADDPLTDGTGFALTRPYAR